MLLLDVMNQPWIGRLTRQKALESRGIHLIPYNRLGRYFKDANVKGLVRDNAAFKLCFGLTFALAAFAEF